MSSLQMAISPDFEAEVDSALRSMKCFSNAVDERHSPLLPRSFILAENYVKSFPQHSFKVDNDIRTGESYLLSPTCCYPVFLSNRGKRLAGTRLVSHKNQCFRCEEYYDVGTRQISFVMREYIIFSPNLQEVTNWIEDTKTEVADYIRSLGLDVQVEVATDPFFNADDYKQKFQKDQNLKSEFVVNGVAVGSVNLHLRAFAKACDIEFVGSPDSFSACFGLGYDRLYHQVASCSRVTSRSDANV